MVEYINRDIWKELPDDLPYKASVKRVLISAPAADVVKVKHGEWIELTECANEGVCCSVCHKKVYKADYAWCNRKNKIRSDYCPNCGANMMPEPPKGD